AAVYGHFRGRLPQLEREVFYVLLLDGKNRVQAEVHVSEGSLTAALVHPREVFGPAIRAAAAALILVHNHPSGDPTPSAEDAAITQRLRQVGELVGIRVLDHVVIGRGRCTSLDATTVRSEAAPTPRPPGRSSGRRWSGTLARSGCSSNARSRPTRSAGRPRCSAASCSSPEPVSPCGCSRSGRALDSICDGTSTATSAVERRGAIPTHP